MFNEKIPFSFISYSHKDSDRVCPIIERLKKEGFNVWYDDGIEPGSEWDENIANHISQCGYFIAFISENYLGSSNCKDELNFSRDLDKDRLLVYLEEVALSGGMAMRMNRNQAIYWDKCEDKEKAYQKLFSAVGIEKTRIFIPKPVEETVSVQQPVPQPAVAQPVPAQQPVPQPVAQQRPMQQPAPQTVAQTRPMQQPVPQPVAQPRPAQQPAPQPMAQPRSAQQPAPQPVAQPRPAQQPVPQPVAQQRPVQQPVLQPTTQHRPAQQPVTSKNVPKKSNGLKIGLIIGGIILALLLVGFVSIMILIVIGSSASSGNNVVIEEDATANELLPLAEDGNTDAMYRLGEIYFYGENGAEIDYDKSLYWMNKAADEEHYDALKFLMFMYNVEASPYEFDFAKSVEFAERVLEQNPEDSDAMFTIGYCYSVGGYGIEVDYEEAVKWYTKAAELGEPDAMYNLALCYYYGYGVEVDQEKFDMWMQAYEEATGN
ncbi:MAG: SEL1-like repeat protein [Lachnospiraceae bacterium]|nr:SEL1-like repeat protein [Lachnospiraceae bacterium]